MWELVAAGAILGIAIASAIYYFWDSIREWLDNTAANAVEKVLGYDARKYMQRAVATVSKGFDKLQNRTTIYTRQSALDTHIHKVTVGCSAPLYEQDEEVIESFEKENVQVQELKFSR